MKFKEVAVIGVGFMGACLSLALKERYPRIKVTGYARSRESLKRLKALGVVDEVFSDIGAGVASADLVVLAVPVQRIPEYLKIIQPYLKPSAVVFDLGSTKSLIEREAKKIFGTKNAFVGCHPLAGSEKSGARFAHASLYRGATCVITSSRKKKACREIARFWESLGSRVVFMKAERHDRIFSALSHFPHFVSFALVGAVPLADIQYAPKSIRELTRIANSPPEVWAEIFLANKQNLKDNIRDFKKWIGTFEQKLEKGDKKSLVRLLDSINQKQQKIQDQSLKQ